MAVVGRNGTATWPYGAGRGQRGQAAVELALLLPVLLLIVVGIVDLGRAYRAAVMLTNAAHQGAVYGSSSATAASDADEIRDIVLADAATIGGSVAVTSDVDTDPYGSLRVSVTASYTFTPLFPYPGLPQSVAIVRTATMRVNPW